MRARSVEPAARLGHLGSHSLWRFDPATPLHTRPHTRCPPLLLVPQVLLPNNTISGLPETRPAAFYVALDPSGAVRERIRAARAPAPAPALAGR